MGICPEGVIKGRIDVLEAHARTLEKSMVELQKLVEEKNIRSMPKYFNWEAIVLSIAALLVGLVSAQFIY